MKRSLRALLNAATILIVISLMISGCAKEEKISPVEKLTSGYYTYSFFAEGYGDYSYFFNFYDEDPVLGSVFYAGFANNQANFAGTYTIEEKEKKYVAYTDREAKLDESVAPVEGTAPYTITFYDWDGNEIDSCAFDGNTLYNDMETLSAANSTGVFYNFDKGGEDSDFYQVVQSELGVTYLDFIGKDDKTSALTLFHNGRYLDLVGMMVEGGWKMESSDDSGSSISLSPDSESDTAAVLTVSADRMSAEYVPADGAAVAMLNTVATGPELVYAFGGSQEIVAYETTADFVLNLYSDGACELTAAVFGQARVFDSGTYTRNGNNLDFTMSTGGQFSTQIDAAARTLVAQYIAAGTDLGDLDFKLTMMEIETAEAEAVLEFTGGYTTFVCYSDNTFKFAFEKQGVEETGTWSYDKASYTFTVTKSNGEEIKASIDADSHDMSFEYVAVISDRLKDTFTAPSSVWGPVLTQ